MKVFLIGFMGSGKTTYGHQVAERLQRSFLDLDEVIERETGMTVREIFEKEGEERFRILEHETLLRVIALPGDPIIAVGGGTPCHFDNMERMNRAGLTLYLQHPPEILVRYLRDERQKRPLIAGMAPLQLWEYVSRKLQEREPFYRQAHEILTWPAVSPDKIIDRIEQRGA